MSPLRIPEYPTKQEAESTDDFIKRLLDRLQEEAVDRIEDFSNFFYDKIFNYYSFVPVGTIVAWLGGYFTDGANAGYADVLAGGTNTAAAANTYLNGYGYYVCDGAELTDTEAPVFYTANRYLPNLTDDRFFMGDTAGGGTGGSSTMAHTHSTTGTTTGAGANHTHADGTLAGAQPTHQHADGTLAGTQSTHQHADGTLAGTQPTHTHGKGTIGATVPAHDHGLTGATAGGSNHSHVINNISHAHASEVDSGGNLTGNANGCSSPTATEGAHTHNKGTFVVGNRSLVITVAGNTAADGNDAVTIAGSVAADGDDAVTISGSVAADGDDAVTITGSTAGESAHTHSHNIASGAASVTENRPKYLSCFYIMKVK